jgi:hypothetical protein
MNLELLARKRDYYAESAPIWIRTIWCRQESFDHFVKHNRLRLTAEGALIKLGRDYFVASEKFPIVAAQILGVVNDVDGCVSHE